MPESDKDHTPYTKRAMARTMIEAMEQLGHVHFAAAGTIAAAASRIVWRSIIPAGCQSSRCWISCRPMTMGTHEPALCAEDLSLDFSGAAFSAAGNLDRRQPDFFLRQKMASQTKSKKSRRNRSACAGALSCRVPRSLKVHAMCEDYRAGAYADFEIDKVDRDAGKKITVPMLALWGDAGIASAAATPLDTWKTWATMSRARRSIPVIS